MRNKMESQETAARAAASRKTVIGITGGVGSGKSRILSVMKELYHAEVILADEVAHLLMEPGQEGYRRVAESLGQVVLEPDGRISREKLSAFIFQEDSARKRVDEIIHPLVWRYIDGKISASQSELIVVEFAIMDFSQRDLYDEIWYIHVNDITRVKRLADGRGYSEAKSRSIMGSQMTETQYRSRCDRVIDNHGTIEDVKDQLCLIWDSIQREKGLATARDGK